jgi:uncharacterized protein (TIGR02600 family)
MSKPISPRQGIALVIVLAFLVLISGIILAFFLGITTEHRLAKTTADTATTQQLAESAVNVVMAQIVDATSGGQDSGSLLSWASQPGMIRTYDTQGMARNCYKLYSSDHMVVDGQGFTTDADNPPPDWNSQANTGLYTDLNAPVLVADPTGAIKPDPSKADTFSAVYPIVDPNAEGKVDGFALTSRPGFADPATGSSTLPSSTGYDPTQGAANTTANPAPMPVKWLYILRNGAIVSSTSASNGSLTIPGVTKDNPVTGRMAFWADDDTSKVNINTASEGVYWDVPRVYSDEDFGSLGSDSWAGALNSFTPGMSICQPVQKEYQRYPGHPATTCLSPIFGKFGLTVPGPDAYNNPPKITSGNAGQFDPYYAIAPKIAAGGSVSGTKLITPPGISGFQALSPDTDRLYASVDELMFAPKLVSTNRVTNPTNTGTSTTPSVLTKSIFEKTKFFLTAGSNAPETTLFNTPRISIWPVWDPATGKNLTAFDKLARFCGTIGGQPYYFTRKNARSDTDDYNGIARNQVLYQYLQSMTGRSIPGFGGDFVSKYSRAERDQILTMIFDYIRCINLADSEQSTPPDTQRDAVPFTPIFNVTVPSSDRRLDPYAPYWIGNDVPDLFPLGAGEVVPIKIGSTMGVGRCLTVAEADLLFYATGQNATNPKQTNKFRAILLLQFASPMQGMAGMRSSLQYKVKGLDTFAVSPSGTGFQSLHMPAEGPLNLIEISDYQTFQGRGVGGVEGPAQGLFALSGHDFGTTGAGVSTKTLDYSGTGGKGKYAFVSSADVAFTPPAAPANNTARSFDFKGGDVTITLSTQQLPNDSTPSVTVQTLHLHFPDGTFQIPDVTGTDAASIAAMDYNQRLTSPVWPPGSTTANTVAAVAPSNLIRIGTAVLSGTARKPSDTVVGLQPAGALGNATAPGADTTAGDIRMIAAMADVPAARFRPHNDYTNTGGALTVFAHGLTFSGARGAQLYPGAAQPGKLAPVTQYMTGGAGWGSVQNNPYVPSRVGNSGVTRAAISGSGPGDWDTGIGNTLDGAYMNKPDEGDTRLICHTTDQTITRYPYLLGSVFDSAPPGGPYFSPNRQVPSPLMFGSIPTGVQRFLPWQTLLFHPRPEDASHPGNASPKDHLIADLFWMPVVEPYAISQPFATSGKINLNYQIVPFTYIKRQTGLHAVMKSTRFLAIPVADSTTYKPSARDHGSQEKIGAGNSNPNRRRLIDIPTTLQACDEKFAGNQIYKSATELCELNLVPPGETPSSMASFWNNNKLTGDNLREKPYVDIYPRITTKSNTYTVHVCVQSLQQTPAHAAAGIFVDPNSAASGAKDVILGEYRGSTTLERYIDPNDPALPDFAQLVTIDPSNSALNIDRYYKFRVTGTRRFAP